MPHLMTETERGGGCLLHQMKTLIPVCVFASREASKASSYGKAFNPVTAMRVIKNDQ